MNDTERLDWLDAHPYAGMSRTMRKQWQVTASVFDDHGYEKADTVREAVGALAALFSFGPESPDSEYFRTIRAELLRLATRNAELEAKATRDHDWISDLLVENKNAYAELAALKARIAAALLADVRRAPSGLGRVEVEGLPYEWIGKRVRLVVEE